MVGPVTLSDYAATQKECWGDDCSPYLLTDISIFKMPNCSRGNNINAKAFSTPLEK